MVRYRRVTLCVTIGRLRVDRASVFVGTVYQSHLESKFDTDNPYTSFVRSVVTQLYNRV